MSSAMIPRTRNGVLGVERKNSGRLRRKHRIATRLARTSDMAQHHFALTTPADPQRVTDPAADHQSCRTALMTEEAIGVEDRARKRSVPILAGNELEAMQMPGEDEVIAGVARSLPDARVVSAQDA